MEKDEIKQILKELADSRENEDLKTWAVLYWKAQGLKHLQIAGKFDRSYDWVQRYMTRTHRIFGMTEASNAEKEAFLENEIYPAIKDLVKTDPYLFKPEPTPPPEPPEPSKGPVEPFIQGEIVHIGKEPPTRPPYGWVFLVLILIAVVAYLTYRLFIQRPVAPNPVVVVVTATPLSAGAPLPFPTSISSPTSLPRPTNTLVPTIPPTLEPTFTVAPPTATAFVLPANGILFQDDFQNGLNSAWQQYSGKWIVSNGKLTLVYDSSTEYTDTYSWIGVENPNWKNYIVSLTIHIYQPQTESDEIALAVRDKTSGSKYIGFEIDFWPHIYLSIISQGYSESAPIAGQNKDFSFPLKTDAEAEIKVENANYTLSVNGTQLQTISMSGYDSGGFRIGLYCRGYPQCPTIGNVKVTYLP